MIRHYEHPLSALRAVAVPDLMEAWDAATAAALSGERASTDEVGGFVFALVGGGERRIVLSDPDALCWAAAVDRLFGLDSEQGVAICFRLLALIAALSAAEWAQHLLEADPEGGLALHPSLLRAAARLPLSDDGRFDLAAMHAEIASDTARRLPPGFAPEP